MADLQRSWRRCWRALGASDDGAAVHAELLAAYDEPQRSYHTRQHLHECLDRFEACRDLAPRPAEVEAALWFHDAVYDVRRFDNERRSADWARDAVLACGASRDVAAHVDALVMATRHATMTPAGPDAQLLVDIDLAILGADVDRFAEYERQIRREYAHVAEAEFHPRRRAILAAFLGREQIYATPRLHAELEQRARANLSLAIAGNVA
ncbi:MAG TPA: N-methyl-D-aspartate receptor NMDAR2C subunit [Caldimonas sp.]|jgi:predicted metal-dependent HD superfamily phosphohydrolase